MTSPTIHDLSCGFGRLVLTDQEAEQITRLQQELSHYHLELQTLTLFQKITEQMTDARQQWPAVLGAFPEQYFLDIDQDYTLNDFDTIAVSFDVLDLDHGPYNHHHRQAIEHLRNLISRFIQQLLKCDISIEDGYYPTSTTMLSQAHRFTPDLATRYETELLRQSLPVEHSVRTQQRF